MDTFCAVTGWMHMWREEEFIEAISSDCDTGECLWGELKIDFDDPNLEQGSAGEDDIENISSTLVAAPSRAIQRGLKYTADDVEGTSNYVLITPCERSQDGTIIPRKLRDMDAPPEILDKEDVLYLFNVYPSKEGPEMGIYDQHSKHGKVEFTGVGHSFGSYLITFCSFLILQQLIPGLEARTFCKLAVKARGAFQIFPIIDYGPVSRTIMQDVVWAQIADIDEEGVDGDEEDPENVDQRWWLKFLTQEGKTDKQILEEAWMGKGNMWVFKHPGIFPIEEAVRLDRCLPSPMTPPSTNTSPGQKNTFPNLPVELILVIFSYLPPEDLLHLITTSSKLYRKFRIGINEYVYAWIQRESPWYLPVGPINCEGGDEEVVRWQSQWSAFMDLDVRTSGKKDLPWLAYHFACKSSPNMRSRERIWRIVLQIRALLIDAELYP
ncbi:hypothetical protein NP233_g9026 [Leucocoprinus birnbaumii]|uniref:F-box domain-containing protein n=1 Tax=Leucocoprinus birnbaumii TaxID=56174 RepID=A0AAD5YT70_9AGAR|nr:hypothetical protein NP233_g9026 [Leucocoprinus birnbaumii]